MADKSENSPTFITRLPSGLLHMGDTQFLLGYCVLFADPPVRDLTDLQGAARTQFLADMARVGDAVMAAFSPLRINYAMLGNSYPFLHAHIFPRYEWEDETRRRGNVWLYPEEFWSGPDYAFSPEKHSNILEKLKSSIAK